MTILVQISCKSMLHSDIIFIFEGELLIKTLFTTLIPIFCIFILHLKVIFKSVTGAEDTGQVDLKA